MVYSFFLWRASSTQEIEDVRLGNKIQILRTQTSHESHNGRRKTGTKGFAQKVLIPPTEVGGSFQMLSTQKLPIGVEIPPTAVGGSFKSFLREDLKYPPTAVGGITKRFRGMSVDGI
jgi:hypothetical protein